MTRVTIAGLSTSPGAGGVKRTAQLHYSPGKPSGRVSSWDVNPMMASRCLTPSTPNDVTVFPALVRPGSAPPVLSPATFRPRDAPRLLTPRLAPMSLRLCMGDPHLPPPELFRLPAVKVSTPVQAAGTEAWSGQLDQLRFGVCSSLEPGQSAGQIRWEHWDLAIGRDRHGS